MVVVGALWQLYIHFYPSKPLGGSAQSTQVVEQHVEEGGTAVIQTGEGKVYITEGISPEQFQSLAVELGITQAALTNFFNILEHKDVPLEEYDNALRKIAKTYKELQEKLERFSSSDPAVTAFKEETREALARGDFQKAEALLNKAVDRDIEAAKQLEDIAEERMLSAAASMVEIGELKEIQLDYREAVSYYRQASESAPKGRDLILAEYLGKWGVVSYLWGKYGEAEKPLTRSLEIREKALGPEHPNVADSLNNLALLYRTQGKYTEADPLYKRALKIWEKALGPEHPNVADSLNNLAGLYHSQGKYTEAEPLYKRALKIGEKALGPDHPHVATVLENMAGLYRQIGKEDEAEKLEARAKKIRSNK